MFPCVSGPGQIRRDSGDRTRTLPRTHSPHSRSDARPPRGHSPSLRFHEWRAPPAKAHARPLRPAPSALRSQWERAGGVVVTCGRRCSGGGPAPPARRAVFIAPFAAPARAAPRAVPSARPRKVLVHGYRAVGRCGGTRFRGCPALRRGVLPSGGLCPEGAWEPGCSTEDYWGWRVHWRGSA